MKNDTNIYDIDGELIRPAGDNHEWTIDEVQKRIEYYTNKIESLDKDDPKVKVYTTYINNLNKYAFTLYSKMTSGEINDLLGEYSKKENLKEQVEKAIEDLKQEVEPKVTEEPKETVMDEYVDYEEVPNTEEA